MLRLPRFDFRRPTRVAEAVRILAGEGPETRVVAGGTDLWPNMKRRHQNARCVVSLLSIPQLCAVTNGHSGGELRIGATTRLAELVANAAIQERYPALAEAVASISSPPLRNMGTMGGNLCLDTRCTYYNQTEEWRQSIDYCMKEVGSVCWVAPSSSRCWAHSASDAAPILCALGARVRLVSASGERIIPLETLYRDDGIDYLTRRPDEILTEVLLPPKADCDHVRSAFVKLRRRGSIDFAVLSCAVAVWLDPRTGQARPQVRAARIYLGAVASRPVAATAAARALVGQPLSEEGIVEAARLARRVATPMDNTDLQAQWRGKMVEVYTAAALRQAAGWAGQHNGFQRGEDLR